MAQWTIDLSDPQMLRLCFATVFIFYFQKKKIGKYKEKTIFLYFLNQKHVSLVEIKKIVF